MHPVGFLFPVLPSYVIYYAVVWHSSALIPGVLNNISASLRSLLHSLPSSLVWCLNIRLSTRGGYRYRDLCWILFFLNYSSKVCCSQCCGGSVSGVQCVRWHSGLADQRTWRSRGDQGGRKEERGGGGCCHFKVCALLSWSAWLCNSHIIIRGRPRPAACQPLCVGSCLLWILRQSLDGNVFWVVVAAAGVYF